MNCKKYLLGLVTMGLVTACTDLDPEIYSNLTTTNAYSTESDIEAAVVGLTGDLTHTEHLPVNRIPDYKIIFFIYFVTIRVQ